MSNTFARRLATSALAGVALGLLSGPSLAQSANEAGLLDRAHKGDITKHGGARRLDGDIAEAFAAAIEAARRRTSSC